MKIKKIIVKNLFGIFNHEIPLNMEDHITIIHGPNGFGKTVLLTMLNGLFSSNYNEFFRIPFSELSLIFDDGCNLLLQKKSADHGKNLVLKFNRPPSKQEYYTVRPLIREDLDIPLRGLDVISGLERIGPETWNYLPSGENLSLEEVLIRFGDQLPLPQGKRKKEPDWLKEIKESIPIRFIETQRLFRFSNLRHRREYERRPPMYPAVIKYSEEVADAIQEKLAEYAALSQSLDRTFPTRLVKGRYASELTPDELRSELNQLEEKRSRLISAGLLDREEEIDLREFQNIDESNMNVLSVYIEDVKKKLEVLDDLTNKIDLLIKIINNRFLYKRMTIGKKDGFIFETSKGEKLPTTKLSSGEQHELVLLYEFLFKVSPNSLILIDEPELSLHVLWQQQFLKDLEDITKLSGFDVVIATHSPQIIHDRWDLTVELKGPKNEEISNR